MYDHIRVMSVQVRIFCAGVMHDFATRDQCSWRERILMAATEQMHV
jgi:hypothetical protein